MKINSTEKKDLMLHDAIVCLSNLEHPNIVQFLGWTEWKNEKVFVMEMMHTSLQSGKTFFNILIYF